MGLEESEGLRSFARVLRTEDFDKEVKHKIQLD